jgi:hypothetical protein
MEGFSINLSLTCNYKREAIIPLREMLFSRGVSDHNAKGLSAKE